MLDVEKESWEQIKKAVSESDWIPKEYCLNDWVSDLCSFLRHRPVVRFGKTSGEGY